MFHVKHEGWELAAAVGAHLDTGTIARLERFEAFLREQALPLGMVSASDAARLRERHIDRQPAGCPAPPPGRNGL